MPLLVPLALGGTALNAIDYGLVSNHVLFASGASTARIVFGPLNDSLPEGTETATIAVRNMAHFEGNTNIVATIGDNEPAPPPLGLKIEDRRNGAYAVTVSGAAARMMELQASEDLRNWRRLGNVWTGSGTNQVTEIIRATEPYLFFRATER